jgi:hypothetical protein
MIRCGIIQASPRTAIGCWPARSQGKFLTPVLAQPRVKRLLSSEHFSVDGTRIEVWASMKSIKPKDPPQGGNHGRGAQRPGGMPRARSAATRRIAARPIRMLGSTARGRGCKRSCASSPKRGLREAKLRDLPKVDWAFAFVPAAYNLVRAPKVIAGTT